MVSTSFTHLRRISFSGSDMVLTRSVEYVSGPGATPHLSRSRMMLAHSEASNSFRRRRSVVTAVRC